MAEYTPHDAEMREAWISTYARDGQLTTEAILRGQREFKQWITAHDAEVRADQIKKDAAIAERTRLTLDDMGHEAETIAAAIRAQLTEGGER